MIVNEEFVDSAVEFLGESLALHSPVFLFEHVATVTCYGFPKSL